VTLVRLNRNNPISSGNMPNLSNPKVSLCVRVWPGQNPDFFSQPLYIHTVQLAGTECTENYPWPKIPTFSPRHSHRSGTNKGHKSTPADQDFILNNLRFRGSNHRILRGIPGLRGHHPKSAGGGLRFITKSAASTR
jgi:hypothetical protein